MQDNLLPQVSGMLQRAYEERRTAWIALHSDIVTPWPKRRSRRRRPAPGVYDLAVEEG